MTSDFYTCFNYINKTMDLYLTEWLWLQHLQADSFCPSAKCRMFCISDSSSQKGTDRRLTGLYKSFFTPPFI